MKEIKFRPLRRIKKTGKITVASYMSWYKVRCADQFGCKLIIDGEYKLFNPDELVYDHNGDQLFWRDFDPEQIPVLPPYILQGDDFEYPYPWKSVSQSCFEENKTHTTYSAKGLDCCGTPTFSHGTAKNITNGNMYNYTLEEIGEVLNPMAEYELLTVGTVVKWFGWFLYQLENTKSA
jgi:hypothetical protein